MLGGRGWRECPPCIECSLLLAFLVTVCMVNVLSLGVWNRSVYIVCSDEGQADGQSTGDLSTAKERLTL